VRVDVSHGRVRRRIKSREGRVGRNELKREKKRRDGSRTAVQCSRAGAETASRWDLGATHGRSFRLRLSKASRKPTGIFNGDFLPWHEGDEENFATFSSRPRRCNVVVGLVGCYAFRVFFFESEGVFKNGGACFRVQDCWLWRESLGIA
jgi:hypothetical protein